jgi:hypothetical protein
VPVSVQCAPGADFRPMLAMVDRVMAARKEMERAAKGAAAKSAPGQQRPQGQPGGQPQQAKVCIGSSRCKRSDALFACTTTCCCISHASLDDASVVGAADAMRRYSRHALIPPDSVLPCGCAATGVLLRP